ncbi:MAG: Gfo/Idh/MocA family oxidoreductase [Armatimonadetes bacterium]|nr:Gfo/Idh/MocA family oxidoreductase [Armatimonadota bacterium]
MRLSFGVVGARRGRVYMNCLRLLPECEVVALCDIDPDCLAETGERFEVPHRFRDYEQMLDSGLLNAVVVSTPQFLHAPQAIAALRRGIHVLSEVPGVVDLAQCCQLVDAVRASKSVYMMGENACYMPPNLLVRRMAEAGLFGEVYFAEAEYTHELKARSERTPWRLHWQVGINAITYPTHQLGPVVQWMKQRITSVACQGSGHHYRDPRGEWYAQEDCLLMLCKTDRGGLVKIRQDLLSDRPHITVAYSLQGTDGCYESSRRRAESDVAHVWLRGRSPDADTWLPLMDFAAEFLPESFRQASAEVARAGHGGSDYWVTREFVEVVRGERPLEMDLHFALDTSAPGVMSQQSLALNGAPVRVPDFRAYVSGSGMVP